MRSPFSVLYDRSKVSDVLSALSGRLQYILNSSYKIILGRTDLSYSCRYGYSTNRLIIRMLLAIKEECSTAKEHQKRLKSKHEIKLAEAKVIYRFLFEEVIRSEYDMLNYRPFLAVKEDLLLPTKCDKIAGSCRRQPQSHNIHEIREALQEDLPEGAYFYGDTIPSKHFKRTLSDEVQPVFDRLVFRLKQAIAAYGGWIYELEGTDTIRGFIPDVCAAFQFLTSEIRSLTLKFLQDEGFSKPVGWSIGVDFGSASVLFGRLQMPKAVGSAGALMEQADKLSRDDRTNSLSGRLTYLSQEFFKELKEAGGPTDDVKELRSDKDKEKKSYWHKYKGNLDPAVQKKIGHEQTS